MDRFPDQFTGGSPDIIVPDEPTLALDISVQVQILNLLAELQRRRHQTCILISYNARRQLRGAINRKLPARGAAAGERVRCH